MTHRHVQHSPLMVLGKYPLPYGRIEKIFSHAHGHGGQNVNKRDTKVQLKVRLDDLVLPDELSEKLYRAYPHGEVLVEAQESRQQHSNLERALRRLRQRIEAVLLKK